MNYYLFQLSISLYTWEPKSAKSNYWLYLYLLSLIILSNFCFQEFVLSCCYQGQDSMCPFAPPGVVDDRDGWPWPQGWFLTWLCIIMSNFCFQKFAASCPYIGQEGRGPSAPDGVVDDRKGWPWPKGWFILSSLVILSNFCFENIAQKGFISNFW